MSEPRINFSFQTNERDDDNLHESVVIESCSVFIEQIYILLSWASSPFYLVLRLS
jgi:hypothetical protein